MGLPVASNSGLLTPGNLSKNVLPQVPLGNTDDCSFSPRLCFPLQRGFLVMDRIFSFGNRGAFLLGLRRVWLTHQWCCGAGCQCFPHGWPARTESGSAACWAHLASFHQRIQPPLGCSRGSGVLCKASGGRASTVGVPSCPPAVSAAL